MSWLENSNEILLKNAFRCGKKARKNIVTGARKFKGKRGRQLHKFALFALSKAQNYVHKKKKQNETNTNEENNEQNEQQQSNDAFDENEIFNSDDNENEQDNLSSADESEDEMLQGENDSKQSNEIAVLVVDVEPNQLNSDDEEDLSTKTEHDEENHEILSTHSMSDDEAQTSSYDATSDDEAQTSSHDATRSIQPQINETPQIPQIPQINETQTQTIMIHSESNTHLNEVYAKTLKDYQIDAVRFMLSAS